MTIASSIQGQTRPRPVDVSARAALAGPDESGVPTTPDPVVATRIRLLAIATVARFHGTDLHRGDLVFPEGAAPSPTALVDWIGRSGLWAKAVRLRWPQLVSMELASPVVLLLNDGSAALLVANDAKRNLVWLRHSRLDPTDPPLAVGKDSLAAVCRGEAILIRTERVASRNEAAFNLGWIAGLVRMESRAMRDVGIASVALSLLTVLPPLMVMAVIDQVVTHQSLSTLVLLSLLIGTALISETLLGYARRQLILVVGARVDAKLNLHVFQRLLRLPLDYFERHQAGTIWSMTGQQINKIREFLTGKLLATILDLVMLLVLLPILFYLQPALSCVVLLSAGLIAVAIAGSMRPMGRRVKRWVDAESAKSSVMVETLHGVSFRVPPGTTLGLVGRSGSGKSTVTRLLQGIARDCAGLVSIDGVDLRDINLTHLRRNLGVVLQENFLFRGSIRENILAGRPGLTLADAVAAAQLAGASEFIERLPNGCETFVEEGSPNLSSGQR